jgi:formate hydrogenlyase transcriptional activator
MLIGEGSYPMTTKLVAKDMARPDRQDTAFQNIVGSSSMVMEVLDLIQMVAPTDATILVQGETGTGKEGVAEAIHNISARRNRNFVKVNCAALPAGLLESQLFGHERGAFTHAFTRKTGTFELANGGTLFLDEIGDMPRELQSKLLRVLQEREFERVGSTTPIRADVRVWRPRTRSFRR